MLTIQNKLLSNYTFIDLFAGIGGFHLAMSSFGATCIFASEWDKYAAETYQQNFNIKPHGDITKINENDIPEHDILCGGFPCQAFSISGKQKGFDDIRGTLFFDIARIINRHNPKVIFLENVKNLTKHDGGKTFDIIYKKLESLNYNVYTKVLNASNYGLPQNRERIYIIAFRKDITATDFNFPVATNEPICLEKVLETNPTNVKIVERLDIYKNHNLINSLNSEKLLNKPIQIGKVNKGGQGERIYHTLGHAITLSAYGGGIGSKTGLYLVDGKIRKLSPRECARVQGFPEGFILNSSDTQSYKQFGNSVSVNVLQHILFEISKVLKEHEKTSAQLKELEYEY
jgi:DNA (cytosine-5)-methyltransferase 1